MTKTSVRIRAQSVRRRRSSTRARIALLAALALAVVTTPVSSSASASRAIRIPPTVVRQSPVALGALLTRAPRGAISLARSGALSVERTTVTAPDVVCAPIRFTAFGISWRELRRGRGSVRAAVSVGPSATKLGATTRVGDESTGEGPDPGTPEARMQRHASDMLWVGDARCAKFTLTLPAGVRMTDVRTIFLNTLGTAFGGRPVLTTYSAPASALASAQPLRASALSGSQAPEPTIITRTQWGANPKLLNCFYGYAPSLKMAFVHHSAGSNSYTRGQSAAIVRGIYAYHTQGHHWCDIGYNFLVDKYGQIFEGREGGITQPVIPAATMGFNTNSVAVSGLGNFVTASPTPAMVSAIERLLAWRLSMGGVSATGWATMVSAGGAGNRFRQGRVVTLHSISGHRDANFTSCPGNNLYVRLPGIRRAVAALEKPWTGGQLAFASDRSGVSQIYGVNADGSSVTQLTAAADPASTPALSSRGTKIAFERAIGSDTEIFTMNADGSNVRQITSHPGFNGEPAWSPDGTQLAFVSDRSGNDDIWTIDIATGRLTQITYAAGGDTDPAWSPDGSRLAFASDRTGNEDIWTLSLSGGSPVQRTYKAGADTAPAWSPDGTELAFVSDRAGNDDIWTMDLESSHIRQMTFNSASDTAPSWSPGGGFLAFQTDRTGEAQVFTIGLNTNGIDQLTADGTTNGDPTWAR